MTIPAIWYPAQRGLRTIVQALVVLVPVVNGVAAAVVAYLTEQTDITVHPTVFVWLNAVIAVTAVIMGLIARIMAVPGVNDILGKVGLGSVPKRDIPDNLSGLLRRDLKE
jgi:hypothetical protein